MKREAWRWFGYQHPLPHQTYVMKCSTYRVDAQFFVGKMSTFLGQKHTFYRLNADLV